MEKKINEINGEKCTFSSKIIFYPVQLFLMNCITAEISKKNQYYKFCFFRTVLEASTLAANRDAIITGIACFIGGTHLLLWNKIIFFDS